MDENIYFFIFFIIFNKPEKLKSNFCKTDCFRQKNRRNFCFNPDVRRDSKHTPEFCHIFSPRGFFAGYKFIEGSAVCFSFFNNFVFVCILAKNFERKNIKNSNCPKNNFYNFNICRACDTYFLIFK